MFLKTHRHCRPRRFGKTLNLSMMRYFFDIEEEGKDLFEGLAVALKSQNAPPAVTVRRSLCLAETKLEALAKAGKM